MGVLTAILDGIVWLFTSRIGRALIGAALVLGLLWWAVAHAVGLWAARADRRFFDVLRRHLALPGHLDA